MKRIISIAILATILLRDVAVATSGKSGKSGGTTPHYLFNDCDTIKRTYTLDARGYAVYPDGRRELVKGSINNRHRRRILQDVKKEKAATTEKKEKSASSKADKAVVVEETKYSKSCKSKKAKSAKAKSAKAKSAKKGGSAKANKNKTTSGAGATGTAGAAAASGSATSSTSEYVDYTDASVVVVEEPWVSDEDAAKDSDKNINGAKDGSETIQASENQMSPVGISLLTIGLVAIVALGTMFLIAKNRSAESYSEFEDEDGDFDDKRTETMSENDGKRAYVMGEEGSVYTSATHDTRFIPGVAMAGAEMGNGNDDSNQVDVHHCTSAMCPICNGKDTVFINALDDESQEPEGYEIYDNGEKIGTRTRSDVTPPSFDNPAEIERPYVVDNTIDF